MITGELRSQINSVWDAFCSGGISNPMEVKEQITHLLFIRRLDDAQTLEEHKATLPKKPIEKRIFPEGNDPKGRSYQDLRWSHFKNFAPAEMFEVVGEHVFPFFRTMSNGSTYSHHMKDARFTIPTPGLWQKWLICLTTFLWRIETPRTICMSISSAKLLQRAKMVSSAPPATLSSSWSK